MDKIFLNDLEFYGYHGVLPEETRLGQRFRISIIIETNLQPAGRMDDLRLTINYAAIYELCKEIVEKQTYQLIEAVAEKIADEILKNYSTIERVTVKVVKPDPPIPGHYHSVAVEITRDQP